MYTDQIINKIKTSEIKTRERKKKKKKKKKKKTITETAFDKSAT